MKHYLFKLSFSAGISLGDRKLSDSSIGLRADRLFSAFCIEYLSNNGSLQDFVSLAKDGDLKLTDAFPFIGEELYAPKPLISIKAKNEEEGAKKTFKKLKYVPLTKMQDYADGKISVDMAENINSNFKLGKADLSAKVSISRAGEDPKPYHVGVFRFEENTGLYFIASVSNKEVYELLDELLESLTATGLGGKKSSGYGRFNVRCEDLPDAIKLDTDAPRYVSLSVGLPRAEEMQSAMNRASYSIIKRSGFVASSTYADETPSEGFLRKKDLFVFSSGSVFANKFEGDVYDVSNGGTHPVYSYAKPIFLGIEGGKYD